MQKTTRKKHPFKSNPPLAHPLANTRDSFPIAPLFGEAPLVNAHKSAHDPIHRGHLDLYASRIDIIPSKIKRAQGRIGGGLRGVVGKFSYGARRRIMARFSAIQGYHYQTAAFLTLTYHNAWQGRAPRKDLENYFHRLRRRHPDMAYIWRLEPQKRLAPHFHLQLFFEGRLSEAEKADITFQWNDLVDPDSEYHGLYGAKLISDLDGMEGVRVYMSKYCAKIQGGDEEQPEWWQGRYWAASQNLKTDKTHTVYLQDEDEVQYLKAEVADYLVKCAGMEEAAAQSNLQCRAAQKKGRFANVIRSPHIKSQVMLKEAELDFIPRLLDKLERYRKARRPFPAVVAQYVLPKSLSMPNRTRQEIVSRYADCSYHTRPTQRAFFRGVRSPYERTTTRESMAFAEGKLPL